jgi:hypothetical protein
MAQPTFLIPKAEAEIEEVIAHPWGLYEMVKWLESKGVVGEPPLRDIKPHDARNAIRCILRELRTRENGA